MASLSKGSHQPPPSLSRSPEAHWPSGSETVAGVALSRKLRPDGGQGPSLVAALVAVTLVTVVLGTLVHAAVIEVGDTGIAAVDTPPAPPEADPLKGRNKGLEGG